MAVLILLPIVAVVVLWLALTSPRRVRGPLPQDIIAVVPTQQVPPALALMMLADYPADQVWEEAARLGQWQGALITWLFGPLHSDRDSLETLVRFADAAAPSDPKSAGALLLAAEDVVRISPELSDRDRADSLLVIGERFSAIGLEREAVQAWRQASILAHYSPSLPAFYRAGLLHDLAVRYQAVGADRLAAEASENSEQVGGAIPVLAVPERVILDTEALPPEPEALLAARERRRIAAQAAAQLMASDSTAGYQELRSSMSAEGMLHRSWVEESLAAATTNEQRAALLLYHIIWLQRERLLAYGFGGDQFPTWEARRVQIDGSLHEAWNQLEEVRLNQSLQAGSQERATLAQRDWWATRLVQSRLGRDPMLDQASIISSMQPNNADGAGGEGLRLDWIQERFWRVPRDAVGTNRLPE